MSEFEDAKVAWFRNRKWIGNHFAMRAWKVRKMPEVGTAAFTDASDPIAIHTYRRYPSSTHRRPGWFDIFVRMPDGVELKIDTIYIEQV